MKRLGPRWRAILGAAVWFAALASLLDGVENPLYSNMPIEPHSRADRTSLSLSTRERGLPFLQRGALHLPDLYPCLLKLAETTTLGFEADLRIPEGSWFDLLLTVRRGSRTVMRLATTPGESFTAAVSADVSLPPEETPLDLAPSCFDPDGTAVRVESDGSAYEVTVGGCGPFRVDREPPGGDVGFASGLAGAWVDALVLDVKVEDSAEPFVVIPAPAEGLRRTYVAAAALTLLLVGLAWDPIRSRWLRWGMKGASQSQWRVAAYPFLAGAVVPVWPWRLTLLLVVVAALLWFRRSGRGTEKSGPERFGLAGVATLVVAAVTLPAIVGPFVPAGIEEGPSQVIETSGDALDLPLRTFPADRQAVAMEIEAPEQGAVSFTWGTEAVDPTGTPTGPSIYPDLSSMLPSLILERCADGVDWYLLLGDVVVKEGRAAGAGRFTLLHRRGTVVLRHDERTLTSISGVPARPGGLRISPVHRPLDGSLTGSVILTPQRLSRAAEAYWGLGLSPFCFALALLLGRAHGALRRPVRTLFIIPFIFSLCALLANVILDARGLASLSWIVIPLALTVACFRLAVGSLMGIRSAPVRATVGAIAFLLLPSLVFPLLGGPASARFTRPWYGSLRSPHLLAFLDPDGRLFNDSALTGLYRGDRVRALSSPGTRRALVLGGSQTYGEGFNDRNPRGIWTNLVERAAPDLDVVNLAVQGSTLASQVQRLRGVLQSRGGHDRVVAIFGMNDGTLLRRSVSRGRKIERVLSGESPWRVDPCGMVPSCSVGRLVAKIVPFLCGRGTGLPEEKRETLVAAVEELTDLADAHNLELVLVREPQQCDLVACTGEIEAYAFPHGFDIAAGAIDEAERAGAVVVDLRDALAAHRARHPFFDLVHLSEEGHRVMARLLEKALMP